MLVGLVAEGRRAGRADYEVFASAEADAAPVGDHHERRPVADARPPDRDGLRRPAVSEVGTALFIDVRGTRIPASVVALPFYKRQK